MELLKDLVLILLGIPALTFSVYGCIVLYYSRKKGKKNWIADVNGRSIVFRPYVTVIVPTHNEESIIAKRIENLMETHYPMDRLEIIFVDDSTDLTPTIIKKYAKKSSNIKLISFPERVGYSPSMIAGCEVAMGDIIIMGDAGSFFDMNTIPFLIRHFRNPNIGVVAGNGIIINDEDEVGKSEGLYQDIFNLKREAETNIDSTFFIRGEAIATRRELIKDLKSCVGTFDTATGLFVRKKGYKVIYDPEVRFYEYAPATHSERIKQKVTRAANLIKILLEFKDMMLRPKYGKYGIIILPFNFALLAITPLSILFGCLLLAVSALFYTGFALSILGIFGFLSILSILFSRSLLWTFLEFEYSLIKALYQIIFTRKSHDKIEKIESTRRMLRS